MSWNGNGRQAPAQERLLSAHRRIIGRSFAESRALLEAAEKSLAATIEEVADALYGCFAGGGKLLVCGNGGSAADSQHFTAELVGRLKVEGRRALPALALTADTAVLTAWSNDSGYAHVFARQVEAFGRPGDLLLVISTSGQSENLLHALEVAGARQMTCVALLGRDGGAARHHADLNIIVPSTNSQRIQEVQLLILHLLCELVEERLEQDEATYVSRQ